MAEKSIDMLKAEGVIKTGTLLIDGEPIASTNLIITEDVVGSQELYLPDSNKGEWIQTFSGKSFYPLSPSADDICIEDIAHALSLICRFNGHCKRFYSVAQHSILVAKHCSKKNKLAGLLHDASEAYACDVPRPIKHTDSFTRYRQIESIIQGSINFKFGLAHCEPQEVKDVDLRMLATERRDLMSASQKEWDQLPGPYSSKIIPMTPRKAKQEFLKMFKKLVIEHSKGHYDK